MPCLTTPMHASVGIWENMVDETRSMHNLTVMHFAVVGNKTDMIKYNMTNHVR